MILLLAALAWFVVLAFAWSRRRTSTAWQDVLAVGVIGVATAGFFWRLLVGQVWMPAGGGDLAQFLYPTYKFAAECWTQGVIPLWNPHLFGGMPFVGDIQSGIFYPLNLLTFFISQPLAFRDLEFLSVLHFFIAGAGMYLFLRLGKWTAQNPISQITNSQSQISIFAALAGAIAFEFSDLFITHFGNLNLIAVVAWMPLVLLFYRRAQTDGRPGFSVVAGVVLGFAFLAGHIQSFLFIIIALVLLALGMMIERRIRLADSAHYIGGLGIIAVVSFAIAAPSLLPAIEFAQNTVRANFSYEQAAQFSLPPAQLIGLVVPGFFGRGPQNAWGPWSRVEVGYLGVLPLVLAFLALVLRRDRVSRLFGTLALIGLALALGGYAILHGWLYQLVPGFGLLRAPARFVVLMDFALATLAAIGFDTLLHALPRASEMAFKRIVRAAPWVFLIIAVPFGALAYSNLVLGQGQDAVLFQRIANATNALAFFILLFALALGLIIARGTRFFRAGVWSVLALVLIFFDLFSLGAYVDASTDDPTRAYEHPEAVAFLKSEGGLFRIDSQGTGVDAIWQPDTAILYGLSDVNGDNPLVLASFDRYWQNLGSRSTRAYDLLNVKYVIARKSAAIDREKFRVAFDGDPGFVIYENMWFVPRAFADNGTATIVGYGPNEILVDVEMAQAGRLTLSEVDYPGWRAWQDDREVAIRRVNDLFRAVDVSAGRHRIRLLYDPPLFKVGVGLFVVIVIVLLGGYIGLNKHG